MNLDAFEAGYSFRFIDNDRIVFQYEAKQHVIKATDAIGNELFYCLVLAQSSKGVSTMTTGITGRRTVLFFAFNQFTTL